MAKLNSDQLKRITSEARAIREKSGTVTVKKYRMSWRDAIKAASKNVLKNAPKGGAKKAGAKSRAKTTKRKAK